MPITKHQQKTVTKHEEKQKDTEESSEADEQKEITVGKLCDDEHGAASKKTLGEKNGPFEVSPTNTAAATEDNDLDVIADLGHQQD